MRKALIGTRKDLTSCRPPAEVSRAGRPTQRSADFMLLSDSCASALRSIFGTLSSPEVFRRKKKNNIFSPLPVSKSGVSRAPREAQPRQRLPCEERAEPREALPAGLRTPAVPRCSALPLPPRSGYRRHPSTGIRVGFTGLRLRDPPVPPS